MKAVIDSVFAEAAMLMAVLADVCLMVGVMGPGWGVAREPNTTHIDSLSLWKTCEKPMPNGYVKCSELPAMPSWFTAVQGLLTTCLLGLLMSFALIIMFTCGCTSRCKEDRRLLVLYGITTMSFSVIGVAGIVLFGTRIQGLQLQVEDAQSVLWRVSWSFGLTIIGACANFLCVFFVIVELVIGPRRTDTPSERIPVIADAASMAASPPHLSVAMETVA